MTFNPHRCRGLHFQLYIRESNQYISRDIVVDDFSFSLCRFGIFYYSLQHYHDAFVVLKIGRLEIVLCYGLMKSTNVYVH